MEIYKIITPAKQEPNSIPISNFLIQFKDHKFNFTLYEIEKKALKIITKEKEVKNTENQYNKYEIILDLNTLKNSHRYFKMFDEYDEFKATFIKLFLPKKVEIASFDEDKIELKIELPLLENNIFTLELKKVEIKNKGKELFNIEIINDLTLRIEELEKNSKLKDEKILSLEKEIKNIKLNNEFIQYLEKEMEKISQMKDQKILSLEKELNELKEKKEKEFKEIKDEIVQLRNSFSIIKEESYLDIFKDSNILINNDDKKLILSWVPFKISKAELLFNSNKDGDSLAEFLKKSNGKYPTLVIIQTTKGGIFGGYTSKPWEQKRITDNDAFVFSLYTKKKYQVKNPSKAFGLTNLDKELGVLVFGWAENAIVICDKSTSNPQNYVGSGSYNIVKECELNNGEKYFTVKSFELFHLLS